MNLTFEAIAGQAWSLARITFEGGETATWRPPDPDLGGPATAATRFVQANIIGPADRPATVADDIAGLGVVRYEGERFIVQQFYARRLD